MLYTCNGKERLCPVFVKTKNSNKIPGLRTTWFYYKELWDASTHYPQNKYQQKYKKILFSAHIYFGETEIQENKITVTGLITSRGFIFLTYSLVLKIFILIS